MAYLDPLVNQLRELLNPNANQTNAKAGKRLRCLEKLTGLKMSAVEEKCQGFEALVIYCSTLAPWFASYLSQTLDVALPCLKFYFHAGLRGP
jgi:hypothetical protein